EAAPERVGLGEEEAGVEGEEIDRQPVAGDHVHEDAALGPEAGGERDARGEAGGAPGEDVLGRAALERVRRGLDLLVPDGRLDRARLQRPPRFPRASPPPRRSGTVPAGRENQKARGVCLRALRGAAFLGLYSRRAMNAAASLAPEDSRAWLQQQQHISRVQLTTLIYSARGPWSTENGPARGRIGDS